LEVFGRRADGFHELETLMVPIRLSDSLGMTRVPASADGAPGEISLDVRSAMPLQSHGSDISSGKDNLVVRALELLRERSGCVWGAQVELTKRIPSAAGLGGGSSDAAAALRLANDLWGLHWPKQRLAEVAAEIGSDVPFFVYGSTSICRGRGEQVDHRLFGMGPYYFVVVKPPIELSTPDVYRAHDTLPKSSANHPDGGILRSVAALSCEGLLEAQKWIFNRLQSAASSISPWVDRLRSAFDQLGFLGHQLSGSGSAYFGICRHAAHARRLATILRVRQLGLVYATRSCG
jgi:4-diphosphocytidyl-2-C-methyl-D-erythritol kinase